MRDLDSHTMRLGKIWFVVAGTCAVGLVTALYKTDRFLDTAGFREKSGALLRTVRVAQANLPSSSSADPRTLVASKVGSLTLNPVAQDSHLDSESDEDKSIPVAELVNQDSAEVPVIPPTVDSEVVDSGAADQEVAPTEVPAVHN